MQLSLPASVMILGAALASDLSAATFTVNSITGIWQNVQPAAQVAGGGTGSLRWGITQPQSTFGQSGLDYTAAATPFSVADSTAFSLGILTHLNGKIVGTGLTTADLALSFDIAGLAGPIVSTLSIDHWETQDLALPCPLSPNPINFRGCADRVIGTWNAALSDTFTVGGTLYTLEILSFTAEGLLFDTFWTAEEGIKNVEILANLKAIAQVPLPAAGLALAAGLLMLPALKYRRKAEA